MTNVERDLGSLVLHLHLRSRQIGLRERDGCAGVRRENRNFNVDSDDEVIALKFVEELIVVVEFGQQVVLADQSDGRPVSSAFALASVPRWLRARIPPALTSGLLRKAPATRLLIV